MARTLSGKAVASGADVTALADKAWFDAHPERDFMLRDPAPLEFREPLGDAGEGFSWRVLIVRLGDGSRLRLPISLAWDLHNDHAKEQHLAVIFEQVAPEQARVLRAAALARAPRV